MNNDFRYEDSHWPKTDAKEYIFAEIIQDSKVLDLGCWTGRLGEKLKNEKKCFVTGIEINKKALSIAKERLHKVYSCDLDQPKKLKKIIKDKLDYIVLADVLEHLKYPENLLECIKYFLKPSGKLIVSVPNIANWSIRKQLLFGNFNYEETGILDKTHLHFWTKKSAEKLLKDNGYFTEKIFFSGTSVLPTLKAVQFVFVCNLQK